MFTTAVVSAISNGPLKPSLVLHLALWNKEYNLLFVKSKTRVYAQQLLQCTLFKILKKKHGKSQDYVTYIFRCGSIK